MQSHEVFKGSNNTTLLILSFSNLLTLPQCKFDFCWVCQESWKRHSSATGGYFRCNRFEAAHRADEKQDSMISDAQVRNTHVQELSRFLHYYTRFRNHENSQRLEEPLLTGIRQKMEILASALPHKLHEGNYFYGSRCFVYTNQIQHSCL